MRFLPLLLAPLLLAFPLAAQDKAKEKVKPDLSKQIEEALKEIDRPGPPQVQPEPNAPQAEKPRARPFQPVPEVAEELNRQLELLDRQMKALQRFQELQGNRTFPGLLDRRDNKGRLGIRLQTPPEVLLDQLDLPAGRGLLVVDVVPGTAASKAGFQKNDLLIEFADRPVVADPQDFVDQVRRMKEGSFKAVVIRKGKREVLNDVVLSGPRTERINTFNPLFPRLEFGPRD